MKVPRLPRSLYGMAALAMVFSIDAGAAECTLPGDNPVVSWSGAAPVGSSLRVYFRADLNTDEHFVELTRATPTRMQAILPRVSSETRQIDYRIVSVSGSNQRILFSGLISVTESCASSTKSLPAANRIVLGAGSASSAIPAGFECRGVVALLSNDGDLRAYRGCHDALSTPIHTSSPQTKISTKPSLASMKGGESFHGGKNGSNGSNGSNGNGHFDHGQGNGYGHCKDHQGPANGHSKDEPPCAPVSSARP